MFGNLLGSIGSNVLGRVGAPSDVIAAALPAASYLSDELLKMLDCREQQQAAKATDQAIRGGVGTEVAWKSESRANVSGSSKVTGQEQLADGTQCLTVTDVVIVDGEETNVPKKMCKAKDGNGYVRV
jgi:surface antigen